MSNHIHLIASTKEPFKLSDFIRDFKAHTHRAMRIVIESDTESRRHWMIHQFKYYGNRNSNNDTFQIWIQDNHPEEILCQKMLYSKLNYIHENPVRVGYVSKASHYLYSSASNYLTGKGILEIDLI